MNCLCITLFFNTVAGIVQTFIKSWNQLLYPSHRSLSPACWTTLWLHQRWSTAPFFVVNISPSFGEFTAPLRHILPIHKVTISSNLWISAGRSPFASRYRMTERTSHLAGLWIGVAISNTSLSKPVLPLSNEHGSQVKDQGRRQCCHNKHKNFRYWPTRDVSLLSEHASYKKMSKLFVLLS